MFPVYDLAGSVSERPETLGSKEKEWIIPHNSSLPETRHLFKIGRAGTGENWSEKISGEIATLLGLPAAEYEFAIASGNRGVLSKCFFPDNCSLILGNNLLGVFEEDYDGTQRYRQNQYTLTRVINIIRGLHNVKPPRLGQFDRPAVDYFVGYLVFDALIGNTDRHHENWGIEVELNSPEFMPILAPTFDHASSLGRELSDQSRERRLRTGDVRGNVAAYAAKARTAFFDSKGKILTSKECLALIRRIEPEAFDFWAAKAMDVDRGDVESIFDKVPEGWITMPSIEFALALIRENQTILQECAE